MLLLLLIFGGSLALSVPLIRLLRRHVREDREERERQRNGVESVPPKLIRETEAEADGDPEPTSSPILVNPGGALLVLLPLGLFMANYFEGGKTIADVFFLHMGLVSLAVWLALVAVLAGRVRGSGANLHRSFWIVMVLAGLSVSAAVFSGASLFNRTGAQVGQRLESVIDRKWEESNDPTSYHISFTMPLQPPQAQSVQLTSEEYEQVVAGQTRVQYYLYPGRLGYQWISTASILPEKGKP